MTLSPQFYYQPRSIALWSLLSFQAGFINSIGFLACSRFVSHVTGFSTHVGISIGHTNYSTAFEFFSAPLFFMFGSMVSGHLTLSRSTRGLVPLYPLVITLITFILMILLALGINGWFGPFGSSMIFERDFFFLNALTFLCGLQNACFASLTQGQIRTTHMTGITTDLGLDMALLLTGKVNSSEKKKVILRSLTRASIFFWFSVGALISAVVDNQLQYFSFIIPMMTSGLSLFWLSTYKLSN